MGERALTSAEINLAKSVFKDSINYIIVKIHNEKYAFFQPDEAVCPPCH